MEHNVSRKQLQSKEDFRFPASAWKRTEARLVGVRAGGGRSLAGWGVVL